MTLALLLLLLLPGTGIAAGDPAPAPLLLIDGEGRAVSLPGPSRRLVSLAPSITEGLFAIGAGDQVVGVTRFCTWPAAAAERPQIGGFSPATISLEAVLALAPDLVVAGSRAQTPVAESLTALGVPTLVFEPRDLPDLYAQLLLLGVATARADQAAALVTALRGRVARVSAAVAAIPPAQRPRVFYEVFDQPLLSAGPRTFIGQLIGLAGGVNLFADAAEDYPVVAAEAILARNPDVIVGPDSHGDRLTPEQLARRPGWGRIAAVAAGRIHLLDGDMAARAGPRLVDVLERLAAYLHPERFQ